jgi:MFS family permease
MTELTTTPPEAAALPTQAMTPALVLGLAAVLTNFDVTAVVIALPAIAHELGFGVAGYAWVMDAYSLSFTSALLLAGTLADRYGRRRTMLGGNAVFAVASLACGIAWDGPILWAARALQGIGAAFVVTGGFALIANVYAHADTRTRAFAWLGVMSGIAMALGPTAGGLMSSWIGWRSIFFVNLPLCALVAWAVPALVAEVHAISPRPIDLVSVALLTTALAVLIACLLERPGSLALVAGGFAISALLVAGFVLRQRHGTLPMFDAGVLAQPAMLGIAALLFAVSVGYWAVLVYLPVFMMSVFGWSADATGLALLAATLPMLIVPPLGGRLVRQFGWRLHFTCALAILAAGDAIIMLALLSSGSAPPIAAVLCGMITIGIGVALAHPQLSGAVLALVSSEQSGMASAMTVVMRQAGFAIGIAVLGATLQSEGSAATNYVWLFAAATTASLLGSAAALILLPAASKPRQHQSAARRSAPDRVSVDVPRSMSE